MAHSNDVSLEVATKSDDTLLSNLLELYMHDLSAVYPNIEMGADGRFGYPKLPLYWSEPERRFAFLIRCGGRVAGFVLATRGSHVVDDPEVLDITEFFVLRRYRRSGIGREAAIRLWNGLPGNWIVRVSEGNPGSLLFWSTIITEVTNGVARESRRPGNPHGWRMFSFTSHGNSRPFARFTLSGTEDSG